MPELELIPTEPPQTQTSLLRRLFSLHSIGFYLMIVLALIGNAAEHSSAIIFALRNRMDLVVGIAVGSSVQIAAFVAPVLVLASHVAAPVPMDLVFTPLEIFAIGFSVLIASHISADGESNWLEGAQLLSVYAIVGLAFYFMPT